MQTNFPRPHRLAAMTAGVIFTALMTAGCHDQAPPPNTVVTTAPVTPPTTVVAPSGPVAAPGTTIATTPDTKVNTNAGPGTSNGTNAALADKVNTSIVHNKQMTGSRVEPVANGGIVTLNGSVQNQQQKALAETTARNVPGVTGIKNKLIIVTTGGAKPKPTVVTKIKTVVVHDQAPPPDSGSADSGQMPSAPATPATPATPAAPAAPAAPDAPSSP